MPRRRFSLNSTTVESPSSTPSVPQTFSDGLPLPKILVFDLDYTLWPFWVDTHPVPPFKPASSPTKDGLMVAKDRYNDTLSFYKDVPSVLASAHAKGIKIAAASRTCTPDLAHDLLRILTIRAMNGSEKGGDALETKKAREFFSSLQIFPGNKVSHMTKIEKSMGIKYKDMLFFDDEERNRNVEKELGVCFKLVGDGVTAKEIDDGIRKWRKRRGGLVDRNDQGESEEML